MIAFWLRPALLVVVRIDPPPPTRKTDPILYKLDTGSCLLRIYRPEPHGQTATGFRKVGPIERFDHHQEGGEYSILYAGFTLSCCLVECFGDTGVIDQRGRRLAFLQTRRPLVLLDLRHKGAMRAGSVAALSSCADRTLSQEWSRHFHATYAQIDGIKYSNAHNEEPALALYERAQDALTCLSEMPLHHPSLRSRILQAAQDHAMMAPPSVKKRR